MIEHFRKEVAKEAKTNKTSSSATQTHQKTGKNPESESWSRFSDFSRLTNDAAIPESMKEEIRCWYMQHESEFRSS